ncbi:MAG TPA: DapH/DapD/GlmU-related protein [Tepidisphaeraceae bacterium]|jgi:serine O-acetyltransferase
MPVHENRIAEALAPRPPQSANADVRPQSDIELGTANLNPPGMSLVALLREDFHTHERDLFSQGLWALAVHRFGNWRMGIGNKFLRLPFSLAYKVLRKHVEWICGINLNYTTRVGRRVHIWHQGGMQLGALEIGNDVHIRHNTTFGVKRRGDGRWMKPTIGDRCDIGAGAVVVGPITVGHDSTIGANVVLAQDVPPNSIVTVPPPVIREKRKKSHGDTERTETGPAVSHQLGTSSP